MEKFRYKTRVARQASDLLTPTSVYLRLRDIYPQSALMECSDYHDAASSRSFIAVNPLARVAVGHGYASIHFPDGSREGHEINEQYTVAGAINELLRRVEVEGESKEYCGLYGYTTFNAVRYFENIAVKDERRGRDDAPDLLYILYRDVIVIDHYRSQMTVVSLTEEREEREEGEEHLEALLQKINHGNLHTYPFEAEGEPTSTLTDEEHLANIRRGIGHCRRGDVFQVVLSRRFVQRYRGDDFNLYRALRSINPSPYLFYFDFGGFRLLGSSPETHCRISAEGRAYIDPIAGTTARTGNVGADRRAAEFLRSDPKENAEHVMLVDLARNDLGRNCDNVVVDFYKDIQYYSHVVHLVSRVSGQLRKESDPVQAFVDTFPAGTLSGAPKVRAMQIITELEPHNRGAYGGCIGFIGLDGSLNQAITIRTFVARGGELWFQAGGGIVARSEPEYELQEVNNKLGALRRAITLAQTMD